MSYLGALKGLRVKNTWKYNWTVRKGTKPIEKVRRKIKYVEYNDKIERKRNMFKEKIKTNKES